MRRLKNKSRQGNTSRSPHCAEAGWALVESLVAAVILTVALVGITQDLQKVRRVASRDQFTSTAAIMAQQVVDNTRNQDYATIDAQPKGTPITLLLNRVTTGAMGPALYPQPLLLDTTVGSTSGTWSSSTQYPSTHAVHNGLPPGSSITVTFFAGPVVDTLRETVNVNWTGIDWSGKNFDLTTIISRHGLHK